MSEVVICETINHDIQDLELDLYYPDNKPGVVFCPIWNCYVAVGDGVALEVLEND